MAPSDLDWKAGKVQIFDKMTDKLQVILQTLGISAKLDYVVTDGPWRNTLKISEISLPFGTNWTRLSLLLNIGRLVSKGDFIIYEKNNTNEIIWK